MTIRFVQCHTTPIWIGLYGSAADGDRFGEKSDFDILVVHPSQSRYWITEFDGRRVEISQYSTTKVSQIYENPQWFGLAWIWEVGKFETAITLEGAKPELEILPLNHLIALLGAIGKSIMQRDDRRPNQEDEHVRSAVSIVAQLAALDFSGPKSQSGPKKWEDVLRGVDELQQKLGPVLQKHVDRVLFYPEHWLGAEFLNQHWNLNLSIPQQGTLH